MSSGLLSTIVCATALIVSGSVIAEAKVTECRSARSYESISTASAALRLALRDTNSGRQVEVILRNDDFYSFLADHNSVRSTEQYVQYMRTYEKEPYVVDVQALTIHLAKRWAPKDAESFFKKHVLLNKVETFTSLGVKNKDELLAKYFQLNTPVMGLLKREYYETYNRSPSFIALLIELGFAVNWGDPAPVLTIRACA